MRGAGKQRAGYDSLDERPSFIRRINRVWRPASSHALRSHDVPLVCQAVTRQQSAPLRHGLHPEYSGPRRPLGPEGFLQIEEVYSMCWRKESRKASRFYVNLTGRIAACSLDRVGRTVL